MIPLLIPKVLSKEECSVLSEELFYLYDTKQTHNDNRCPISDAVYGAKLHKNIAYKLIQAIQQHTGVKLFLTFVYSRIYRKGEILKIHTDREECEYSVSVTLGHSGINSWEMFIKDYDDKIHKFTPDIGDLIVFKGNSMNHWREQFTGEWQTQAIFSFVNSKGKLHYFVNDPTHAEHVPKLIYE